MSRDDGFDVMDVSVAIMRDAKMKRLARIAPDRWSTGMVAYLATMAASWEAGDRVSVEDAWPSEMTPDPLTIEAMQHVDLIDANGLINAKTWRAWFGKAKARRAKARADWRKYQADRRSRNRGGVSRGQGGVSPESAPDTPLSQAYPSVPPVRPSEPSEGERESLGTEPAREPEGGRGPRLVHPVATA